MENIIVITVPEDSIIRRENLLPKNLKAFRGTLSVHQVPWNSFSTKITLRKVSRFLCDADERSIHGKHLGFYHSGQNTCSKNNDTESENLTMLAATAANRKIFFDKNKKNVVLKDITFKDQNYINFHYFNKPSTSI
ncbi:hypothetical protein KGM_211518 [Danaus plexippus plexippus]|uniref:Uncharacterized protein n=1 Tax=Danaus plexippus plexippus TaxID=278856 RepID=A0A212EMW4_DANPL|nr:hypothetical protein KGM_211518 [Danaus plexippus plexippus]